jgi:hypothetical protein
MSSGRRIDARSALADAIAARSAELYQNHRTEVYVVTDRTLAALMIGQWMFAVVLAIAVSPYAWEHKVKTDSMHVWAAFVLGGMLTALPVALAFLRPGSALTRHVIAAAQMLWSALLIHLTGGRIETHFHAFASLFVLSFYRDWKVLLTATVVLASDHLLRGLMWPESLYGIVDPQWWLLLEHGFWTVFCVSFLVLSCKRNTREMRVTAQRTAELEVLAEGLRDDCSALERRPEVA